MRLDRCPKCLSVITSSVHVCHPYWIATLLPLDEYNFAKRFYCNTPEEAATKLVEMWESRCVEFNVASGRETVEVSVYDAKTDYDLSAAKEELNFQKNKAETPEEFTPAELEVIQEEIKCLEELIESLSKTEKILVVAGESVPHYYAKVKRT